jgi:hypothetical protein
MFSPGFVSWIISPGIDLNLCIMLYTLLLDVRRLKVLSPLLMIYNITNYYILSTFTYQ